jgi:hypothetical protein
MTQQSMLTIFNAALLAQGQNEVAENDGSNEYRMLARNWPIIIEAELEHGLYHFTRQQAELLTRSDGKFGFEDSYLVPEAAIFVRRLWTENDNGERDLAVDWVQDGTHVHANADAGVFIEYVAVPEVDIWSANFTAGVQAKLEAVICRALKEEPADADRAEAMAEMFFDRARTRAAASRSPTPVYNTARLVQSRFRRG